MVKEVLKKLFIFRLILISSVTCHKKKPFLLLPLVDNSLVTDNSGGFLEGMGSLDDT